MKRINIVCNYASEYGGNFIPSLLHLFKTLKSDFEIYFCFPEETKNRYWIKYLIMEKINIVFFDNNTRHGLLKTIKRINRKLKPDYIYFHFFSPLLCKVITFPVHKRKIIIHIHSDFSCGNKINFKGRISFTFGYRLFNRHFYKIFVSNFLYNRFAVDKDLIVKNGYCQTRIPSSQPNEFVKSNLFTFLLFGWDPKVKGVDIAYFAFLRLPISIQKNCCLVIVCKRGDGIITNKEFILKETNTTSLHKNVILIKPQNDSLALMESCNVFLSCSRSEGFSYSVLEALVNNVDLIVSDIPGTSWANIYTRVYSFPSGNSKQLSILMENLYKNRNQIKKERDITSLKHNFDINEWAESIKKYISKI